MEKKSATLPITTSAGSWIDQLPVDTHLIKRTIWTECTPLPSNVSEQFVAQVLQDHEATISMHPNLLRFTRTEPPPNCAASEQNATWFEISERVQYLPNFYATQGEVTYKACFEWSQNGLYTHVFAPAGLDIILNWAIVNANQPNNAAESASTQGQEQAPRWCLMEDVDFRCNIFLFAFTKRNLRRSHAELAAKIIERAKLLQRQASEPLAETSQAQESYVSTDGSSLVTSSSESASVAPSSSTTTPETGDTGWSKLPAT